MAINRRQAGRFGRNTSRRSRHRRGTEVWQPDATEAGTEVLRFLRPPGSMPVSSARVIAGVIGSAATSSRRALNWAEGIRRPECCWKPRRRRRAPSRSGNAVLCYQTEPWAALECNACNVLGMILLGGRADRAGAAARTHFGERDVEGRNGRCAPPANLSDNSSPDGVQY